MVKKDKKQNQSPKTAYTGYGKEILQKRNDTQNGSLDLQKHLHI